ncbi:hypothetical protein [Nostoc sp. UCD121]|nr:hypothetical protein [Nostoc sp. UCD121]
MVDLGEFTTRCDRYNIQPSFDNLIVFLNSDRRLFTDFGNSIA